MDYLSKALHVKNRGREIVEPIANTPNVLFVATEAQIEAIKTVTEDHIYAREAASQLASMVAALDVTARCIGIEVLPTAWQKFRWSFYAIGLVVMFAIGGFSIGLILDDANPEAIVEAYGISAPIYDRKECYDRIKGVACMNGVK